MSIVAEKKYVSDNARLMQEWNYSKNNDLGYEPSEITFGSTKKVWWICDKGHEWQATPNNRSKGQGCPYCAGRKVLIGFNDLFSRYPDIASEWHPNKNTDILPTQITFGSNKRVWWLCAECGYEWQTSVANRTAGKGCPICSKRKQGVSKVENIIIKQGSFAEHYPHLLAEWDYIKNDISPYAVTKNSTKKIWWKCKSCNYSWQATVYHRTLRNQGCPACNNSVVTATNSLAATHPEILKKWNYVKNTDIYPEGVTAGSNKKVWWVCDKGHEWKATVNAIVNGGICPVCCGQQVLPGYNDLATTNPELATEWHPTRNGELLPTQFTAGSSRLKIWWLCPHGHEYQARIVNRSHGTGCPICDKERKTSFPEQAIFYYLGLLTKAENRYLYDGKTEIDIFLPQYSVGIEYDGYFYHQGIKAQEKESQKDALLRSKGIRVIRVKEVKTLQDHTDTDDVVYCIHDAGYTFLKSVIERLILRIGITPDITFVDGIDIDSATPLILSAYIQYEKENSLAAKSPEIAADWHPTKNGYVTPEKISYASSRKVWWLGKCGHEWQMSVDNRNHGMGCPICANKQVLAGFNDLKTTHPELAAEWDYTKNITIQPSEITYGSTKKVWWVCGEGHSYQATPFNRSWGKGCPICGKVKSARNKHLNHIINHDCLDITHPHLCAEWNQELNGNILPSMVTRGSDFKAWWNCEKGHNYQATVANRVAGKGCPICAGKKIAAGINDLVTLNPNLANEWDYDINILNPRNTSPNSHKKAHWICSLCGHKWEAQIKSRNTGVGCPKCARKKKNNLL